MKFVRLLPCESKAWVEAPGFSPVNRVESLKGLQPRAVRNFNEEDHCPSTPIHDKNHPWPFNSKPNYGHPWKARAGPSSPS